MNFIFEGGAMNNKKIAEMDLVTRINITENFGEDFFEKIVKYTEKIKFLASHNVPYVYVEYILEDLCESKMRIFEYDCFTDAEKQELCNMAAIYNQKIKEQFDTIAKFHQTHGEWDDVKNRPVYNNLKYISSIQDFCFGDVYTLQELSNLWGFQFEARISINNVGELIKNKFCPYFFNLGREKEEILVFVVEYFRKFYQERLVENGYDVSNIPLEHIYYRCEKTYWPEKYKAKGKFVITKARFKEVIVRLIALAERKLK